MYLGDTPILSTNSDQAPVAFKDMTAEQQAAFLAAQDNTGVAFKDMTADQQAQFLNNSDWNALTPAQQSALLNTLTTTSWIPGVSNSVVLGVAGALVLFMVLGRK